MQYNVYGQPTRSRVADIGSNDNGNGVYIQPPERVMQGTGLIPSSSLCATVFQS